MFVHTVGTVGGPDVAQKGNYVGLRTDTSCPQFTKKKWPSQGFLPNISFQAPRGLMFSFHLPATLSIKSEWPRSMACPWQPLHQFIILLSTSLRKELLLLCITFNSHSTLVIQIKTKNCIFIRLLSRSKMIKT